MTLGAHDLAVRQTDLAGHTGMVAAVWRWTVLAEPPKQAQGNTITGLLANRVGPNNTATGTKPRRRTSLGPAIRA